MNKSTAGRNLAHVARFWSTTPFWLSYDTAIRKRQKRTPKFYWFDTGVRRALAGTVDDPVRPQSFEYGSLFESFIVNEIFRLLKYAERACSTFDRINLSSRPFKLGHRGHNAPSFLPNFRRL